MGQLTVARKDYNICKSKYEYKYINSQETQLLKKIVSWVVAWVCGLGDSINLSWFPYLDRDIIRTRCLMFRSAKDNVWYLINTE